VTVKAPTTLTCKEVVELVTEFLSDSLAPEDRARLEQHLLVCPPCTVHVGQVRTTVELTAELHDAPGAPAIDVAPALVDLFRRWKQK
jgi:anti-sigma factor RsiW